MLKIAARSPWGQLRCAWGQRDTVPAGSRWAGRAPEQGGTAPASPALVFDFTGISESTRNEACLLNTGLTSCVAKQKEKTRKREREGIFGPVLCFISKGCTCAERPRPSGHEQHRLQGYKVAHKLCTAALHPSRWYRHLAQAEATSSRVTTFQSPQKSTQRQQAGSSPDPNLRTR